MKWDEILVCCTVEHITITINFIQWFAENEEIKHWNRFGLVTSSPHGISQEYLRI